VPKTSSIRLNDSIQYRRVTDRQTDRETQAIANTALAQRYEGKMAATPKWTSCRKVDIRRPREYSTLACLLAEVRRVWGGHCTV